MEEQKQQPEFNQAVFNNFWRDFVLPEIEKRQEKGELPKPVTVKAFQIIFFGDGKTPREVRINKEVKILATIKFKDGISKDQGDPIFINEIEDIVNAELIEEEQDFGHATWFYVKDNYWFGTFNFQYNRNSINQLKEKAQEFLSVAEYAYENDNISAFIDNLFSSTELISRAISIAISIGFNHDPALKKIDFDKIRHKPKHSNIKSTINELYRIRLLEKDYKEVLNRLSDMRNTARYDKKKTQIEGKECKWLITTVKSMLNDIDNYKNNPFHNIYVERHLP